MACDLTLVRGIKCKDSIGGIDRVFFINNGDLGTIAKTGDAIATIAGTQHAYEYIVKNDASTLTSAGTSDINTGTSMFETTLELTFPNLTVADHKELKLLLWGQPHVIVKDKNGNYFMCGTEFGCDVMAMNVQTGGAMADMSGYTLTIVAKEKTPFDYFVDTVEATLATSCNLIILKADGTFVS